MLASLDLTRQRAFAVDDPVPLSGVYSDVALLRQDRATLRHVVTPGCRLLGLRTVYRRVHASSVTPHQVVLSTQASLAPARLICPHRPPRDLAAHVPVDMTIMLARVGGQFLIASIQVPT